MVKMVRFTLWTFTVTCYIIYTADATTGKQWSSTCPPECTCVNTSISKTPVAKWLKSGSSVGDESKTTVLTHQNEVFYHEDNEIISTQEKEIPEITMAICALKQTTDIDDLMLDLPEETMILTLLQSADTSHINLHKEHFMFLKGLTALDIQGYRRDKHKQAGSHHSITIKMHCPNCENNHEDDTENRITISDDALHGLHNLEYLSLYYVRVGKSTDQTQKMETKRRDQRSALEQLSNSLQFHPLDDDTSKYVIPTENHQRRLEYQMNNFPNSQYKRSNNIELPPDTDQVHELSFSAESIDSVVPYDVYKEDHTWYNNTLTIFSYLSNLVFLRAHSCNFRELNWEMFLRLDHLKSLFLESNQIRFLPDFAFFGAPYLHHLSLAHNKILDLKSSGLAGLLDLKSLDLSNNNISHLSELTFPPFPQLIELDLRYNPIMTVFPNTFAVMNVTKKIYVGDKNQKLEILPNSFFGLDSLEEMSINNIAIQVLQKEHIQGMPSLKKLIMEGKITFIEFDAFLGSPSLEKLILKHCGIDKISMDAFFGLTKLTHLDLSNNKLEKLPPGLFDHLYSVQELQLQNNRLSELPPGILHNIPAQMIQLNGNPWHCSCHMKQWKPATINKVKAHIRDYCLFKYDKGSMCKMKPRVQYVYDGRVSPRCATPEKYRNWNVFLTIRKELKCKRKNKTQKWKTFKEDTGNMRTEKEITRKTTESAKEMTNIISSTAGITSSTQTESNNILISDYRNEITGNTLHVLGSMNLYQPTDYGAPDNEEPYNRPQDSKFPVNLSRKAQKLRKERLRNKNLKLYNQLPYQ